MRIVGGKYKARVLKEFSNGEIRPTADKTRESLFNILGDKIYDSSFLDLFAGTGGVGLEAISRGAKDVVFVDCNRSCLNIAKSNIELLKEKAETVLSDGIEYLKGTNRKFDYIFLDPPYKTDLGIRALEVIFERNLVSENGAVIFETEFDMPTDFGYMYEFKQYGRAKIGLYTYKKEACIFAGTFDPVTKGHVDIIEKAKNEFKKVYVPIMINKDKTPTFDLEFRLKLLNTVFANDKNVIVDYYDGFVVDYAKKVGTDYYVRGIRNNSDLEYEKKNEELSLSMYGNLKTVYYKAEKELVNCSSTNFKNALKSGGNYKKYLPKETVDLINGELLKLGKIL